MIQYQKVVFAVGIYFSQSRTLHLNICEKTCLNMQYNLHYVK